MINQETALRMKTVFADSDFATKFNSLESFEEVKNLFVEYGIVIDDEDLKNCLKSMIEAVESKNGSEVSEEELDNVSGGFVGFVVAGVVLGTISGVSLYKLRRFFNNNCSKP